MVRKRSRKYESDDNDSDSDLDFDFEPPSQPAAKKYSLRERKRAPLLTTDFDYYGLDEEDGEARKHSSEDEDFEVEADVDSARNFFEPEADTDPQNSEGLIDFEDIIRADIVVNKNKIDYDNLIQKTEIKLTQPKKRGRKPKIRNEGIKEEEDAEPNYVCEPDLATLTQLENQDALEAKKEENEDNEEDKMLQPEINFCEEQGGLPNGESLENVENGELEKGNETDPLVIKNANSIEMVMLKPPPIQEIHEEEKVEEDDDDVIILEEVKQDVIVLDD